ncbi:murein transglycosylase A [Desulfoplanes formicivorans]|uniref:peptidoglycan lytic exotransglycosylase n=1 Tax=Desulfoplanes formicivorans TaxID=1592317 RepID=A0A194AHS3_9BACT|nr:MltA domain-containing protein [Desulfoplanes formicivorans]GAU09632.1 transglycosylase [Desulfoplanes formicivorans]
MYANRLFMLLAGLLLAGCVITGCTKPCPPCPDSEARIRELVPQAPPSSPVPPHKAEDATQIPPAAGYVLLGPREKQKMLERLNLERQRIGSWQDLGPALAKSLAYLRTKPDQALAIDDDNLTCTYGDLRRTVEELITLLPELDAHPEYLLKRFHWYKLEPNTLMTGYYEPLVHASPAPCPEYPFPLYGVPKDLKMADLGAFHPRWAGQKLVYRIENGQIVPYYDRKAIDSGDVLAEQGVEIAWVRDLVDIFFLQIQGSGRLVFPDGSIRHVLYAGKNGHRYVSLGKVLIESGYMNPEEMSMQNIRTFLKNRPDMVEPLLNTNPSYVFFRLADKGPYGAMGQPLTPLVSVASDPDRIPLGSVLVHQVSLPDSKAPSPPVVMLGLAQDRGGAIKGDRLDLFCGAGDMAAFLAGHMKEEARVCLLISSKSDDH